MYQGFVRIRQLNPWTRKGISERYVFQVNQFKAESVVYQGFLFRNRSNRISMPESPSYQSHGRDKSLRYWFTMPSPSPSPSPSTAPTFARDTTLPYNSPTLIPKNPPSIKTNLINAPPRLTIIHYIAPTSPTRSKR